ncbi:sensor histidine kinase [Nonomuraea sp. H19]|uniref:sensor histidine kinase n=1 Tax=Nonomuraea sp. H19 TaxID=3452206 RepID=UPI003F8B0B61
MTRTSIRLGTAAGILLFCLVVGALAVEPELRRLGVTGIVERFDAFRAVAALAFGLPGLFVLSQVPSSRVGRLMAAVGAAQAVGVALSAYGLLGINGRPLPGDDWAMWLSNWLWVPAYLAVPTLFLLIFPDGRLPSPRWRPVAALAVTGIVISTLDWALRPVTVVDVAGLYPAGYAGALADLTPFPPVLRIAGGACAAVAAVLAVASLAVRYRRAQESSRRQLQWVLAAALATVVMLGAGQVLSVGAPLLVALAPVPLPAAVAVAVVAHRLWDLDLLLSRALAFGAVSALLLGAYALAVLTLGRVVGAAASAALVAFAVHPLYAHARARANQFVYGDRDDPRQTLRRLGTRLSDAELPGRLLDRMAAELGRSLRMHYVAVEESGTVVAQWGRPGGDVESVELHHAGERVGTLMVGERLRPKDRALLAELAPHLAVAVHAHRLDADLERSHQRLLAARQEERDRLLYELHDGLGPTLAALALHIDRGRRLVDTDPDQAKELLGDLAGRTRTTVDTVRAIVHDLAPPPLDDLGLAGALTELGKGFAGHLTVEVDVPPDLSGLPASVELAAYRITAEALTNAARHAHASVCTIRLRAHHDLELTVHDDGTGVASPARHGFGLTSMRRRAEELNGTFDLATGPGAGTSVLVRLPLNGAR